MAKKRKTEKPVKKIKASERIVLRTGEALVEAEPAWSAAEPEVVIGELDGDLPVRNASVVIGQKRPEAFEVPSLPHLGKVLPKLAQHGFEQRQRPTSLEQFLRRKVMPSFASVELLSACKFQRDYGNTATTLSGLLAVALVVEKVLQ